jgi:hypothetical protein
VNGGKTKVWFQAATMPTTSVVPRSPGEEAGKVVRYSFELQSLASHAGQGSVTTSQIVRQAYTLNFYSG